MPRSGRGRVIVRIVSAVAVAHGAYLLFAVGILLSEKVRAGAGFVSLGAMLWALRGAALGVVEITSGAALFFEKRWSQWLFLLVAVVALDNAVSLGQAWFITGGVVVSERYPGQFAVGVALGLLQAVVSALFAALVFQHFKPSPKPSHTLHSDAGEETRLRR